MDGVGGGQGHKAQTRSLGAHTCRAECLEMGDSWAVNLPAGAYNNSHLCSSLHSESNGIITLAQRQCGRPAGGL